MGAHGFERFSSHARQTQIGIKGRHAAMFF
jgi:hypothetical protein